MAKSTVTTFGNWALPPEVLVGGFGFVSINKKQVLIMILLSFIPLVLLSAISTHYLRKSLEEETINQCRELATEVKLQIDGYLDRALTGIKIIASDPAVRTFDLPQVRVFLLQVRKEYPDISFTLDDAQGNQVVRGDDVVLVNVWDRAYFQSALQGNKEAISEGVLSRNTNEFVVNLGTPVRDETGAIVGVMQGAIALTKISEFVTELSTRGTVAYVIDNNGKILAHPDVNLVKGRFDMSGVSFVKEGLAERKNGFSIIGATAAEKKLVTYLYDLRTGWLICLEVPYAVIANKTQTLTVILGLVTAVVLAIVGALVLYIAKRKKNEEKLMELATVDELTNIANRRYFIKIAEGQMKLSRRRGSPFCILMIDADNFKLINDTYGHDIGDLTLKKIVEICRYKLQEVDFIGRWGGEEFAVLLPETDLEQGAIVAERIRQAVQAILISTGQGSVQVTISIGVAVNSSEDPDVDAVLKKADVALYAAKVKGRNTVCVMGENMLGGYISD